MPPLRLDTPVKFLKGVGEHRALGFERLGIRIVQDLLWHLPFRYLDAGPLIHSRTVERLTFITSRLGQQLDSYPRMNWRLLTQPQPQPGQLSA